ncbi:hypothetical protein BV25DRAFT_1828025 [Artomyces pyxidatus]|uniref:Uncharacterized protein n=1 Tax=Artomyces pyxidatus TaxID=48021 RepID=A0ACB8SUS7_9AGAM|nr:hypothetical protein BV25DRAFT_1828025 [Artomyces pyxidatus]
MEFITDDSTPTPLLPDQPSSGPSASTIIAAIVCGVLAVCVVFTGMVLLIRQRTSAQQQASYEQRRGSSWLSQANEWRQSRKFEPITFAEPAPSIVVPAIPKFDRPGPSLPENVLLADRYPSAAAYPHMV